jgi:hypothetical protein
VLVAGIYLTTPTIKSINKTIEKFK